MHARKKYDKEGTYVKELHTEIEIHAPAERVWQLLTDFENMPDWNPSMEEIKGEPVTGARLEIRFASPNGKGGMRFKPRVLKAEPNRELRWLGHLGIPGLFDGEHIFTIEPLDGDRVRFVQRELFTGLLVPFLSRSLDNGTHDAFDAMNRTLKEQAEQQTG
jgi:hypothetical protein